LDVTDLILVHVLLDRELAGVADPVEVGVELVSVSGVRAVVTAIATPISV
jgi:hypothetical protein